MKKLILALFIALSVSLSANAIETVLSTNLSVGLQAYRLLSATNVVVKKVIITSDKAASVELFDCNQVTIPAYGTNYTNAAFQTRASYASNVVTENIGATGYTNYLTNTYIYSLFVTNAANTNRLPAIISSAVAANGTTEIDTDAVFAKGLTVLPSTNVTIILYYKTQ